jgi:hypothetical protein
MLNKVKNIIAGLLWVCIGCLGIGAHVYERDKRLDDGDDMEDNIGIVPTIITRFCQTVTSLLGGFLALFVGMLSIYYTIVGLPDDIDTWD